MQINRSYVKFSYFKHGKNIVYKTQREKGDNQKIY